VTNSTKKKISAREVLADIRAGMTDSQLELKYNISNRSLRMVYRKLVAAGVLTEDELPTAEPDTKTDSPESFQTCYVYCPSCKSVQAPGATECSVCGVVFEKLAALQSGEDRQPIIISSRQVSRVPHLRSISIVIVGCVLMAVLFVLWWGEIKKQKGESKTGTTSKMAKKKDQQSQTRGRPKSQSLYLSRAEDKPTTDHGQVIDLEFSDKGFPMGLSVSEGFALHLFDTPDANQGFKKFPEESDAKRHYDQFSIAGATYLVITEESSPPKLYLDANRNGDLTDDLGPFEGERPGLVPNYFTIMLPARNSESGVPYRLWLFPSRMGGIRFYPQCHWQGQLELNGKFYKLVLFDGNADGDYSNDPLIIDIDDDGKAAETEKLKPGQSCDIDGTDVKLISIAPSGRWVQLEF
jgi:hypothetical protein